MFTRTQLHGAVTPPATRSLIEHRHALHQLGWNGDAFVDLNGQAFDPTAYSRFKYGNGEATRHYARQLADVFLSELGDWLADADRLPVLSGSAYKVMPTAAQYLVQFFAERLERKSGPLDRLHIYRQEVPEKDFSHLPYERRIKALAGNHYRLTETWRLKGRRLIVLDDIRVTGAHEANLTRLLNASKVSEVCFLYIAQAEPDSFATTPELEHRLNQYALPGLDALRELWLAPDFCLNARIAGLLMRWPNLDELEAFFRTLGYAELRKLQKQMEAEGFHKIASFDANWDRLRKALNLS